MARPTVMTPEIIEKLEEAFLLGCTDTEACLVADIAPATLYNYQEKNPEFVERKEQLKSNPVYKARKSVVDGLSKNPDLALKFLERKRRDEFSTRTESDVKVEQVTPILGGKSKEEADALPGDDSNS